MRQSPTRQRGHHREGKKNRKFGRNLLKCAAYKKARKHEKSHIARLERHIARHPRDLGAPEALRRFRSLLAA